MLAIVGTEKVSGKGNRMNRYDYIINEIKKVVI